MFLFGFIRIVNCYTIRKEEVLTSPRVYNYILGEANQSAKIANQNLAALSGRSTLAIDSRKLAESTEVSFSAKKNKLKCSR